MSDTDPRLTADIGAATGATNALLGDFGAWSAACDLTIDTLDRLVDTYTDADERPDSGSYRCPNDHAVTPEPIPEPPEPDRYGNRRRRVTCDECEASMTVTMRPHAGPLIPKGWEVID